MKYEVHNCGLNVGNIKINGVSSSSVFLIGDNEHISLSAVFDTPPESLIVGPYVPLARKDKRSKEKPKHE